MVDIGAGKDAWRVVAAGKCAASSEIQKLYDKHASRKERSQSAHQCCQKKKKMEQFSLKEPLLKVMLSLDFMQFSGVAPNGNVVGVPDEYMVLL
jgi:coenzyme F420-reducing hydrogenase gamma subunit